MTGIINLDADYHKDESVNDDRRTKDGIAFKNGFQR